MGADMHDALQLVHAVSGFIILAESLNKIERSQIFDDDVPATKRLVMLVRVFYPKRWTMRCVVTVVKVFGWAFLAAGGAGAIVLPLIDPSPPALSDVATTIGFALLIIRSRLREFVHDPADTALRPE